jgi:hypothetical protein
MKIPNNKRDHPPHEPQPAGGHEAEGEMEKEEKIPFGTREFWLFVCYCLGLTCVAGLMSGLTVGYNGLNQIELNAIEDAEVTPDEENFKEIHDKKKLIKKLKPILSKKHLLLVTLLLTNAVAMEALPIFLDAIVPAAVAIILSTTAVLIFGEVIPQVIHLTFCNNKGILLRSKSTGNLCIFRSFYQNPNGDTIPNWIPYFKNIGLYRWT